MTLSEEIKILRASLEKLQAEFVAASQTLELKGKEEVALKEKVVALEADAKKAAEMHAAELVKADAEKKALADKLAASEKVAAEQKAKMELAPALKDVSEGAQPVADAVPAPVVVPMSHSEKLAALGRFTAEGIAYYRANAAAIDAEFSKSRK